MGFETQDTTPGHEELVLGVYSVFMSSIGVLIGGTGGLIVSCGFLTMALGEFLTLEWATHPDRYPESVIDNWLGLSMFMDAVGTAMFVIGMFIRFT